MFDCVLLIAGRGTRTNLDYNKAFYEVNKKPLYIMALEQFLKSSYLEKMIVVAASEEIDKVHTQLQNYPQEKVIIVSGGKMRQDSVYEGVKLAKSPYVLIHDGARPFIKLEDIEKVYHAAVLHQAAVLATPLTQSIKEVKNDYIAKSISRENIYLTQTPQALKTDLFLECLNKAYQENYYGTDDVELVEKFSNVKVKIVLGSTDNIKITTPFDLKILSLYEEQSMYRIGHSHDTHRLVKNRKLILGGIEIPHYFGLLGHSDADVVLHVVSEAIIGALGKGDLGTHFPDTDPQYKDIDSKILVQKAYQLARNEGYKINNLDLTVFLEKPILKPYITDMKKNIAKLLECDENQINLKATRGEGLGYIGAEEGISAECVVLLVKE